MQFNHIISSMGSTGTGGDIRGQHFQYMIENGSEMVRPSRSLNLAQNHEIVVYSNCPDNDQKNEYTGGTENEKDRNNRP